MKQKSKFPFIDGLTLIEGLNLINDGKCWCCGKPLKSVNQWFVVAPEDWLNDIAKTPPAHKECAEKAILMGCQGEPDKWGKGLVALVHGLAGAKGHYRVAYDAEKTQMSTLLRHDIQSGTTTGWFDQGGEVSPAEISRVLGSIVVNAQKEKDS